MGQEVYRACSRRGQPSTLSSVIALKVSKVYIGRQGAVGWVVPTSDDAVPIDALRRLAATRAAATSVNAVAMQVGMTARGLQLFLNGSTPYAANRQKLLRWYVREVGRGGADVDADTARAALQVLMHSLPPARRGAVEAEAVSWWARVYADEGVPPPEWVNELGEPRSS